MIRPDKFTTKTQQALQNMQGVASEFENQELDAQHLLLAMLQQENSLAASVFDKLEIRPETVIADITASLNKKPKVSGGSVYMSKNLEKILNSACVNPKN